MMLKAVSTPQALNIQKTVGRRKNAITADEMKKI